MLTTCQAWTQCLERVRLPFGRHGYNAELVLLSGYSAEWVLLSGCAYRLPGMGTVLSRSLERALLRFARVGVLTIWRHGQSAERVLLSGCAYLLPGMDTVLLELLCLPFGRRRNSAERVLLSGCAYQLPGKYTVLISALDR